MLKNKMYNLVIPCPLGCTFTGYVIMDYNEYSFFVKYNS